MFKTYLKIAWRNIIRHKAYTTANILGLALGVCACIVIYVITSYELSFDSFHKDKERIYRVMGDVTESTGDKLHFARLPLAALQAARNGISGVEAIAGIIPYDANIVLRGSDKSTKNFSSRIDGTHYITTVIAEPQYFDIFKYRWLAGNPSTALATPLTVVLTESKARQYFGAGTPDKMLGKQLIYDDSLTVSVTGIIKDWDENTDLAFTDFISFATLQNNYLKKTFTLDSWSQGGMPAWIFTKLLPNAVQAQVNTQFRQLVKKDAGDQIKLALWLEPLADIHFNADVIENPIRTAHLPTLYSLMAIAVFILLIAVINFINLSTAQSIQRAKEVGVRKVLGSSRMGLVLQFLTETFVLTFIAIVLAVLLVKPVLAAFSSFIPAGILFNLFQPATVIIVISAAVITTIFAGLYPAKVLSSYLPVLSLKGAGMHKGGEKWLLRKVLIVFQFSVSLVFIIGSMVITNQLAYTREKDLGFNADAIITAFSPPGDSLPRLKTAAQKIKQIPGVTNTALQWVPPMTANTRGMKLKFKSTDIKDIGVTQVAGNEDYIPLYQIKLLVGRNLMRTDTVNEFIINESLCKLMGINEPAKAIGKTLYWNNKPYPVVGVVADFHTSSLHDPITPLCIINRPEREFVIAVKLAAKGMPAGTIKAAITQIERVWKQVYPGASFNYKFYDETLAMLYEKDQQTATLTNTAMGITIFISCMGLFGLALFTAEKRAKEISIRKILGATAANIATLVSKDFIKLVIIALFIASPVAWYIMNQWLQGFAYRIHIGWWVFVLAGVAAITIALVTVSFQALKAAITNPVKNLRAE